MTDVRALLTETLERHTWVPNYGFGAEKCSCGVKLAP